MNFVLLLGAGFSRNWGGWLAPEAFEYLLGCREIRANTVLKSLLWKHQSDGGFEDALAEVQAAYVRDPIAGKKNLIDLQGAIVGMFDMMNAALFQKRFERQMQIEHTIVRFLSRFDAIFTLNQDLLLEHHYLSINLSVGPYRNWSGHDLPGICLKPDERPQGHEYWSLNRWTPVSTNDLSVKAQSQPLFKLHGSSNWDRADGSPLLIIGGNKVQQIQQLPILSWYADQFNEYLRREKTRLMIVGYGFGDGHINESIQGAVLQHGTQLFNISPRGAEQARSINKTRAPGHIGEQTAAESIFEQSLIGASRRPLLEIFGADNVEFSKVERFFED